MGFHLPKWAWAIISSPQKSSRGRKIASPEQSDDISGDRARRSCAATV